jgi:hypothetical protein
MNGVNDSIPRSQTAGCSQLLMLENYLPEMRSNAFLHEHPNQKTIAGHDNTSVITSPCRFATPRYPLYISLNLLTSTSGTTAGTTSTTTHSR